MVYSQTTAKVRVGVLKAGCQILYCVVSPSLLRTGQLGLWHPLFLSALLVLTMYGKNRAPSPLLMIIAVYLREGTLTAEEEALLSSLGRSPVLTSHLITGTTSLRCGWHRPSSTLSYEMSFNS